MLRGHLGIMSKLSILHFLFIIYSQTSVYIQCLTWVNHAQKGVFVPEQFGVLHTQLTGELELLNNTKVAAHAILYIKALETDKAIQFRGLAYFLDATELTFDNLYVPVDGDIWTIGMDFMTVANFMGNVKSKPIFRLERSGVNKDEHQNIELQIVRPFVASDLIETVDEEHLLYKFQLGQYTTRAPFSLTGSLNISNLSEPKLPPLLKLCIGGWPVCGQVPLRQLLADAQPIATQQQDLQRPTILTLLKPLYGSHMNLVPELLFYHTLHHNKLGVDATLVYDRGDHLLDLLHHPGLASLVDQNLLQFLKWTHNHAGSPLPGVSPSEDWGHFDQQLIYSHAALSFWGLNTYLYFADLDEYLNLPPGQTLPMLMSPGGCLHNKAYIQISRFNYHCPASMDAEHAATLPLLSCDQTVAQWADFPKCLVLADAVAAFFVHDGFTQPDYKEDRIVRYDTSCCSITHLHNLQDADRGSRVNKEAVEKGEVISNGEWMWPLLEVREELLVNVPEGVRPLGGQEETVTTVPKTKTGFQRRRQKAKDDAY